VADSKQTDLALALAAGRTVKKAAAAVGLSERSVYRRLADPVFRRQVADLRRQFVARAVGRMCRGTTKAATRLLKLVDNADAKVALGAAKAVLELAVRLRDSEELEARVAELEAKFAREDQKP
jgi:molybdenum-dependent DNA-binding transcriptional regulator ModE